MWARGLVAVGATAVLLSGLDCLLAVANRAGRHGNLDPVGGVAAVLGFMSLLAVCALPVVALLVRFARGRASWVGPAVAAGLTSVLLGWIDRDLLAVRPVGVAGALSGFAALQLWSSLGLRRRAWRRTCVASSLLAAVGLAIVNDRAFVGLNPDQHLALAVGGWAITLPVAFVLAARVETTAGEGAGRRAALLGVGLFALLALSASGSSIADQSPSARRFVRMLAPQSSALLRGLEPALDADRDGHGAGFGGGDCAPFDAAVFPGAGERAGDGVDQNCMAGDPSPPEVAALQRALMGEELGPSVPAERMLLITVDALRHDHPLPNAWARLAGRCRAFDVGYTAAPSTTYAIHALMTGRYPSQGVYTRLGRWNVPIEDPAVRVAQRLRESGWVTGASLFHHRFDPRLGLVAGFDHVWIAAPRPEVIDAEAASATIEDALAWSGRHPGSSFQWVHLYDPHEPYLRHDEDARAVAGPRERYAAEVRHTDLRLSQFLDRLPSRDRTAIVLTGDHGEAFGEHGEHRHGTSLFDEQVRVPLWVCPPRGEPIPPDPGPVSGVDVAPTLLALASISRPAGMGGRSLLAAAAAPVFAETAGESTPMTMVVVWPHKLVHLPRSGLWQLFDLAADPGEHIDIAEAEPERLLALQTLLDQWWAWRGPESPSLRAK